MRRSLEEGFCFTMVHPVQNQLAKELIRIIPCAEMVKFFTAGSDATSAAIRIARVFTGRDKIVRWGYHGWHDWCYAGAGTDRTAVGVPSDSIQDILTFRYNDVGSLEDVLTQHAGQVAAVIMQPFEAKLELPEAGFLEGVRELTQAHDVLLIFDEIRTGFRVSLGGAQEYFGVTPDLAAFSKAMANGYPLAAVVGRKDVMEAAARTRLSATFIVNAFPMHAALATLAELERRDGIAFMWRQGRRLCDGLAQLSQETGIEMEIKGLPPVPFFRFTEPNEKRREAITRTFFTETIRRGVLLHPNHHWFLTLAHQDRDVEATLEAARAGFQRVQQQH